MDTSEAIERINALLDDAGSPTTNTSMRIPNALRDAALLAVEELGAASSTTALTVSALETILEGIVVEAVLEEHYCRYPEFRPDLADLAIATAELDGHPLAAQPERLRQAAMEISQNHPEATPEDVLLWAEARTFRAA